MTVEEFNIFYQTFRKKFSEKVINGLVAKSHVGITEKSTVDKEMTLKLYILERVFQYNKKRENHETLLYCVSDRKNFINFIAKL